MSGDILWLSGERCYWHLFGKGHRCYLQCTSQPPTTKSSLVQNISSTEGEIHSWEVYCSEQSPNFEKCTAGYGPIHLEGVGSKENEGTRQRMWLAPHSHLCWPHGEDCDPSDCVRKFQVVMSINMISGFGRDESTKDEYMWGWEYNHGVTNNYPILQICSSSCLPYIFTHSSLSEYPDLHLAILTSLSLCSLC